MDGDRMEPRTLVGGLLASRLPASLFARCGRLGAESLIITLLSSLLVLLFGLPHGGFIALFLVAASLSDRFSELLEENRSRIWEHEDDPWHVNRRSAISVLSMFLGSLTGFVVVAVFLSDEGIGSFCGFALKAAAVSPTDTLAGRFGSIGDTLSHNVLVLLGIVCLCLIYRTYGAVLTLGWNACVWSFVLTVLVRHGAQRAGSQALLDVAKSLAAILPHLVLELLAYVLAALAGIFASKALAGYGFADPRLHRVLRAVGVILVAAVVLLAAAAVAESTWAPLLIPET
jgi:hypothetical protein